MSFRYLVDGKRPRIHAVIRVHECGRRVHAWQLSHDLYVDVEHDFAGYWEKAQQNGQQMRRDEP